MADDGERVPIVQNEVAPPNYTGEEGGSNYNTPAEEQPPAEAPPPADPAPPPTEQPLGEDRRYNMGYPTEQPPPPLDDRPLPTRTRQGQPAQSSLPPPGLVDISHALDHALYTKYHSLLLAAGSMAQIGAGAQVFLTCVIQAYANCKFDMDSSELTWLLCSIFILYPIGACFLGWAADRWGRKWTMVVCGYLVLSTGILQILASVWWVLFVARLIMGFFLPGITNIPLVFWLEVSSYNHREEGMLGFLCLFSSGAAYDFCLAAIFSSISTTYAYELICGLAILPVVFAIIFSHLTVEGPRWLGVGSTLKEADTALREYGYRPVNPAVTTPLDIYFVHQRGNICIVFAYLCCAASAFATLMFCNLYIEYSVIVILPYMFYWDYCGLGFREDTHGDQLLKVLTDFFTGQKCDEISTYSFLYLLAVSVCLVLGLVVGYFTQQYFGSRVNLITYSIISCVALAFLEVCWSYVTTIIELVLGLMFVAATQYSLWSCSLIQGPTFMRASVLGYADCWGKIGALCAIAICSQLGDRYLLDIVFWMVLAVGIFQIFFACLVMLEAKGSRVFDNLPSDPRANEPPPLCLPPGPPPPPPPPPRYYPPPPPDHRPYYY